MSLVRNRIGCDLRPVSECYKIIHPFLVRASKAYVGVQVRDLIIKVKSTITGI